MLYVFYGIDDYLIKKEIEKVKKKNKIEEVEMSRYNLEVDSLKDVVEDASMPSMFSENKLIICENAMFLTGSTKKGLVEQDVSLLDPFFEQPDQHVHVLFIVPNEKLDERKKIVKKLKKEATIKACNQTNNIGKIVENMLDDYQMSPRNIQLLIQRSGENLMLLENEIEKLKIYKWDDKVITEEDILELTTKTIDINVFTFIDNIIAKKKEQAMETYDEMIKLNQEPIAIIIMLAGQFRIMYQSKELLLRGYTEKSIAETLGVHPFRVKKAIEKARMYSSETLLTYLKQLRELDYQIKNGLTDKNIALELFILGV